MFINEKRKPHLDPLTEVVGSVPVSNLSLLTDFYQLSMAYAYWKAGLDARKAVFHLFFRRPPFKGGFTIACGLESVINFIENFHIDDSDVEFLSTLKSSAGNPYFDIKFLKMLSQMKLTVSLDAVPEGTCVFPYEPLLRIEGPLMQCQLLESPLLNLINFPTLIATKAARICLAAQGDPVSEFGLRRAQGVDGALSASRSAYIGGCSSTSNVLAGKIFNIPLQGTITHSWVMAFDGEEEAFEAYAKIMPDSCVFLVDTYDTIAGIKTAIRVGKQMQKSGKKLMAVRLDSGDLAQLSIESRKLLDDAGFEDVKIIASNELDETVISELKRQGAKISMWGVGTNLVTGKEQGALDGVYKLSALQDAEGKWRYTLKLSEQLAKVSNPGLHQIRRYFSAGVNLADVIYDLETGIKNECVAVDPFDPTKVMKLDDTLEHRDLLVTVFSEGKKVYDSPPLEEIRKKTQSELASFPVGVKRFLNPHTYSVGMEQSLYEIKTQLIKKIRKASVK